jgi:serine/threonine protein kinase
MVKDRYRIEKIVGSGGFGAVYRALDTHNRDRAVALKHMLENPNQPPDEYLLERFEVECTLLERLRHGNIPQFYDHFRLESGQYLVMEFIDGLTLEDWIDQHKAAYTLPDPAMVIRYALQACDVLEFLHGQPEPILHRDVKPQNMILRPGGATLVLVDFGLARSLNIAQTGSQVGTVGYAAMEQIRGRPEPCSDIYGLGATMFHLLTLQRPTPFAIPPVETVRPDLPRRLSYIVNMACDQTPARRFMSATKMRLSLEDELRVLSGLEPEPLQPTRPLVDMPLHPDLVDKQLPKPVPARPWPVLAATLLVTVLVLRSFLHGSSKAETPAANPTQSLSKARSLFSLIGFRPQTPNPALKQALQGVLADDVRSTWQATAVSIGVTGDGGLRANGEETALLQYWHGQGSVVLPATLSFRVLGSSKKDAHLAAIFGEAEAHLRWHSDTSNWDLYLQGEGQTTSEHLVAAAPADSWIEVSMAVTTGLARLTERGKRVQLSGQFNNDQNMRFMLLPADGAQAVRISEVSVAGAP